MIFTVTHRVDEFMRAFLFLAFSFHPLIRDTCSQFSELGVGRDTQGGQHSFINSDCMTSAVLRRRRNLPLPTAKAFAVRG